MKKFIYFFIFLLFVNCSGNKKVYWCGDHPCINNKEKEAYFKKTMTVEIRELKKGDKKTKSEVVKIIEQARVNEKKRIKSEKMLAKEEKLKDKMRIKKEKELAKQAKINTKNKIKQEKKIAKLKKAEKKREIKKGNKLTKKIKIENNVSSLKDADNKFDDLVKMIVEKNIIKPYPNINDIPE